MTRRERVLKALDLKKPDKVPLDLGSYPGATSINVIAYKNLLEYLGINKDAEIAHILMFTAEIHDEVLDILNIDTKSVKPSVPLNDFNTPAKFEDPNWKITWKKSSDFTYAPVYGPFQSIAEPNLDDIKRFTWPKPYEIEDPLKWKEKAKRIRDESDRALVARLPMGPVSQAQFLRGFEGWATDLYINSEFSQALHRRITDIWIETAIGIADSVNENVDVFIVGDDFSLQEQAMMNPDLYRQLFKPLLKEMVTKLKLHTRAKIGLHVCGTVYEFIDDFAEMGFDLLNPLQSNARDMEPEKLKARSSGKLALWGGIDSRDLLSRGSREQVRQEVHRKIDILGNSGGYILCADHNILVNVPPANVVTMYEAALEYGSYV